MLELYSTTEAAELIVAGTPCLSVEFSINQQKKRLDNTNLAGEQKFLLIHQVKITNSQPKSAKTVYICCSVVPGEPGRE